MPSVNPDRRLIVDPDTWAAMHHDPWNDRTAEVRVVLDSRTVSARLRIRGGHTRGYPKPSYELRIASGHTFHWNAEYDDPSMIRNALSFYFFNMIGLPAPKTTHCRLIVNGRPLGVYLEIEAVVPAFFRARRIRCRSILYAINDHAHFGTQLPSGRGPKQSLFAGYERIAGGSNAERRLESFIRDLNRLEGLALKRFLEARLDIRHYLRWLAGAVLTGNYDGFEQNYALYEHLPSGRYRIIPWDYEGTWGRNCYGVLSPADQVSVRGYNHLTAKLFRFPEYRQAYRRLLLRLLRDAFTTRRLLPAARRMIRAIEPAIRTDDSRKYDYREFLGEIHVIRRYIRDRRTIVLRTVRRWAPMKLVRRRGSVQAGRRRRGSAG